MFERRPFRINSSLAPLDSQSDVQIGEQLPDSRLQSLNVRRPSVSHIRRPSERHIGILMSMFSNTAQLPEPQSDTVSSEQLSDTQSVGQLSERQSDIRNFGQLSDSQSITSTEQSDEWGSKGLRRD